ncbi:MAG: DNA-3-methyladenine glycosylase I [bacterium]
MKTRCPWANSDSLYINYHDHEWGVPEHDDNKLFEKLILEGFQAGLSWFTILKKREKFKTAFDDFDPNKMANYDENKVKELLSNEGIIRNRLKIEAAIQNARAFLVVQKEFGSFDTYIWQFVNGKPIQNAWKRVKEIPAKTLESEAMSKDLLRRNFKFVGPTICYAYMQSMGLVNDHLVTCFRHEEISHLS